MLVNLTIEFAWEGCQPKQHPYRWKICWIWALCSGILIYRCFPAMYLPSMNIVKSALKFTELCVTQGRHHCQCCSLTPDLWFLSGGQQDQMGFNLQQTDWSVRFAAYMWFITAGQPSIILWHATTIHIKLWPTHF